MTRTCTAALTALKGQRRGILERSSMRHRRWILCSRIGSFVAIAVRYKGYRYPIEVIGHAVWLYHRFALSLRDLRN